MFTKCGRGATFCVSSVTSAIGAWRIVYCPLSLLTSIRWRTKNKERTTTTVSLPLYQCTEFFGQVCAVPGPWRSRGNILNRGLHRLQGQRRFASRQWRCVVGFAVGSFCRNSASREGTARDLVRCGGLQLCRCQMRRQLSPLKRSPISGFGCLARLELLRQSTRSSWDSATAISLTWTLIGEHVSTGTCL